MPGFTGGGKLDAGGSAGLKAWIEYPEPERGGTPLLIDLVDREATPDRSRGGLMLSQGVIDTTHCSLLYPSGNFRSITDAVTYVRGRRSICEAARS